MARNSCNELRRWRAARLRSHSLATANARRNEARRAPERAQDKRSATAEGRGKGAADAAALRQRGLEFRRIELRVIEEIDMKLPHDLLEGCHSPKGSAGFLDCLSASRMSWLVSRSPPLPPERAQRIPMRFKVRDVFSLNAE